MSALTEALAQIEQANYGLALTLLEELVHREPRNAEARRHLAEVYLRLERPVEAEATARAYLKLRPQEAEGHYLLGRAFEKQEQWEEARRELARAVQLDPLHERAQQALRILPLSQPTPTQAEPPTSSASAPAEKSVPPSFPETRRRSPWAVRVMGALVVLSAVAIVAATMFPQWAGNDSTSEPKPPAWAPVPPQTSSPPSSPVAEAEPQSELSLPTPAAVPTNAPPDTARLEVQNARAPRTEGLLPPRPQTPPAPQVSSAKDRPFARPRSEERTQEEGITLFIPPAAQRPQQTSSLSSSAPTSVTNLTSEQSTEAGSKQAGPPASTPGPQAGSTGPGPAPRAGTGQRAPAGGPMSPPGARRSGKGSGQVAGPQGPGPGSGPQMVPCPNCGGRGRGACGMCGGRGTIPCPGPAGLTSVGGFVKCVGGRVHCLLHFGEGCTICNDLDGKVCPVCHGRGFIVCPVCKGRGQETCSLCGGRGQVSPEKLQRYRQTSGLLNQLMNSLR